MRERGYDHLSQHKYDHERLLDEIRDIMEDYEVNDLFDERCWHSGSTRGFPGISRATTRGCIVRSGTHH